MSIYVTLGICHYGTATDTEMQLSKFLVFNGDVSCHEKKNQGHYDSVACKFSTFSFEDQMSHVMDYVGGISIERSQ